ncbi:tyrosine-type recombinase/integrase [uncultured Clostridium sp.]|uniref:tyrosine-type recombinase/integrase n=1 Tax=uncultured Clostridium sp. TaxID=59620 RepID=UPI0025D9BF01|nr:tyrosine-type recombinase/integrase [uncultured Clostridium sp.]
MDITKQQFEEHPKVDYIFSEYLYKYKIHMENEYYSISENNDSIDVKKIKAWQHSYKINYYNIMLFDKYLYMKYGSTDFSIRDVREEHVQGFLDFCYKVMKNKPITINQKLVSLRLIMKYICKYYNVLPYNIALMVPKLKIETVKPQSISYSDIKKILTILRDKNYGIRDVCICKIIMTTGMKITSIFHMKVSDIDIENRLIKYNNSGKDIFYPIQDTLYNDLCRYLNFRSSIKPKCDNLFINSSGKPKNIRSFQIAFRNAVIKANLDEAYTAQNLRASFLYEMGRILNDENELSDLTDQKIVKQYIALKENHFNDII